MLVISVDCHAQDRPNAKQSISKPKVSSSNKGSQIKYNKLVKTKSPNDEYAGVRTGSYAEKKPKKPVESDTVDVADDIKQHPIPITETFYFDENPQSRDNRENAFFEQGKDKDGKQQKDRPAMRPRPAQPEDEEDENTGLVIGLPGYALSQPDDPGAESEDEILLAGDSGMVHSTKMDVSTMAPIDIELVSSGKNFVFPTPQRAIVTSHFGPRRRRFHYGLDLAMPTGEPIYAAFDGVVRFSKYNSSYGHLVVIRHDNGLETYYAHLSKRHVMPGMRVKAGELIGLCGNTGRSRGSHLHFEIRYKGNAMNPENVIDCSTRDLISPTLRLTSSSFRKVAKRGAENGSASNAQSTAGNYSGGGQFYKVRTGDTLSRIAKRNGTTISKLCKLNGLKETSILRPGQKLRLR